MIGVPILVGSRTVERNGQGGRRLHEVHTVDRTPILEDVATLPEAGPLVRIVGSQLAVEVAARGDDRRERNAEWLGNRRVIVPVFERSEAAVDDRRLR